MPPTSVTASRNSSPDLPLISSTQIHAADWLAKVALNSDHLLIKITLSQTVELSNAKTSLSSILAKRNTKVK